MLREHQPLHSASSIFLPVFPCQNFFCCWKFILVKSEKGPITQWRKHIQSKNPFQQWNLVVSLKVQVEFPCESAKVLDLWTSQCVCICSLCFLFKKAHTLDHTPSTLHSQRRKHWTQVHELVGIALSTIVPIHELWPSRMKKVQLSSPLMDQKWGFQCWSEHLGCFKFDSQRERERERGRGCSWVRGRDGGRASISWPRKFTFHGSWSRCFGPPRDRNDPMLVSCTDLTRGACVQPGDHTIQTLDSLCYPSPCMFCVFPCMWNTNVNKPMLCVTHMKCTYKCKSSFLSLSRQTFVKMQMRKGFQFFLRVVKSCPPASLCLWRSL